VECAAFDADPAMTLFQWAVDAVNRLVEAHGGRIRVDVDLKAGMLRRIDLNVLAYMRHMRALRFPVEATDCAVTYVGAGAWCCHYPRHEVRSGHTELDREGHRATWRRSGTPAATTSTHSRSTSTRPTTDRSDRRRIAELTGEARLACDMSSARWEW
jgi:hypothetical protein